MRGLSDKRFIIGGGATGMGAALALRLAEEGARLLVGDVNAAGLDALASASNGAIRTQPFDLLDEASIGRLVARAVADFGGLDGVAITGADLSRQTMTADLPVTDFSPEIWGHVLRVNTIGHGLLMKAAIPHLKAAGGGSIVSVTSAAAYEGGDWIPAYGASKAALHALIRHVARIGGRDWIRCNGIAPGLVETAGAMANVSDELRASILASQPLQRLGAPEDMASAMAFLLSDEARWITGQVIAVNGGSMFRD